MLAMPRLPAVLFPEDCLFIVGAGRKGYMRAGCGYVFGQSRRTFLGELATWILTYGDDGWQTFAVFD
jgi:hypothetical protein